MSWDGLWVKRMLLHQALPDSRLNWVPAAGHSSAEPAIAEALVAAVRRLGRRG